MSSSFETFRPPFFDEERFTNEPFTLTSYSDGKGGNSSIIQEFKSDTYEVYVMYNEDLSVQYATCQVDLDKITEAHTFYFRYIQFKPAILNDPRLQGTGLVLKGVVDFLHTGTILQTWDNHEIYLSCSVKYDLTPDHDSLSLQQDIRENTFYYPSGTVKAIDIYEGEFTQKKTFFENGKLELERVQNDQGVIVDLSRYFKDDGSLIAEQDFNVMPMHNYGYRKVKQMVADIFEKYQLQFDYQTLKLQWVVEISSDDIPLTVDAISGNAYLRNRILEKRINPETTFIQEVRSVLGDENVLMFPGEQLYLPSKYKEILLKMIGITQGELHLDSFSESDVKTWSGEEPWRMDLQLNSVPATFELNSGWLDAIVIRMNGVVAQCNVQNSFYMLTGNFSDDDTLWSAIIYINRWKADYFTFLQNKYVQKVSINKCLPA